jgi:tetratricopeptide (TPR) repeat protein
MPVSLGERSQAIEHYKDMLRLNPGDNQGIRYILANCLLEEGLDSTLGDLFKQYEDDGAAAWLYSRALWVFRSEGKSVKANKCLKEALKENRFVPSYLLGRKRLPMRMPEYIGFGYESEAVEYANDGIRAWQKTEGALEWLAGSLLSKRSDGV